MIKALLIFLAVLWFLDSKLLSSYIDGLTGKTTKQWAYELGGGKGQVE